MNPLKVASLALTLTAGTMAQAATLTFDGLNTTYGDGSALGPNMTSDGPNLTYAEGGYLLTLHGNTYDGGAHIGDGTNVENTFNWHDEGDNGVGAFITLTKAGGGTFNLASFDYATYSNLSINGVALEGAGTFVANYQGVSSVTFSSSGYSSNQLDNISVTAGVPEPASWALMIGGFGMTGFAMRRRPTAVTA